MNRIFIIDFKFNSNFPLKIKSEKNVFVNEHCDFREKDFFQSFKIKSN